VDLQGALSPRAPNVLDAIVSREQIRFEQTTETVCTAWWVLNKNSRSELQAFGPATKKAGQP